MLEVSLESNLVLRRVHLEAEAVNIDLVVDEFLNLLFGLCFLDFLERNLRRDDVERRSSEALSETEVTAEVGHVKVHCC